MKKTYRWFMFLFSMAIIYFLAGCQGYGDTSTLYISKGCPENITDLYVEYGDGTITYIYSKELQEKIEKYKKEHSNIPKKIIKVGDIATTPVSVTCSFERKPEADFQVLYRVDFYYRQNKKWMHSHIFCGNSKVGCFLSKAEIKILSDGVSELGYHFLAKRYFRASEPISRPQFITGQD